MMMIKQQEWYDINYNPDDDGDGGNCDANDDDDNTATVIIIQIVMIMMMILVKTMMMMMMLLLMMTVTTTTITVMTCLSPPALLSAAIFGNVSSIMLRMYQGSDELHEKLQSVKDFVNFHHMPKTLANRLQESFQHNWAYTNGIDMNNVSFPPWVQSDSHKAENLGPVSWRPTTVKWQQPSQSNRQSTISTRQTEYHGALTSSATRWGVTARSPTMVTLHDTRFVECRWWNDGWTVKTVVTWRSSASMIPAPGLPWGVSYWTTRDPCKTCSWQC